VCPAGLQYVLLAERLGIAAFVSEETHQADSSVCRFGSGESGRRQSSDSVEDIGYASLVGRFCVCLAEDSGFGFGFPKWLNCTINFGSFEWRKGACHAGYVSVCEILDSSCDGQSQA
jgi:hypothetical protein